MLGLSGMNVVLVAVVAVEPVAVVAGVPVPWAVPLGEVGGVVMTWCFFFSSARRACLDQGSCLCDLEFKGFFFALATGVPLC